MQHAGISQTPGYIGFNLAMREVIEQRTPKKDRSAKDELGFVKKTNLKYLLTLDQARVKFEAEVLKWDIMSVGRKKSSPMDRWNSDTTLLRGVRKRGVYAACGRIGAKNGGQKRELVTMQENSARRFSWP